MQTNYSKLRQIAKSAKSGARWIAFDYKKDDGTVKRRNILIGARIDKAMEKRGNPVKGKGNWVSESAFGPRKFLIQKNGEVMVRGFEKEGEKTSSFPKVFKLSKISNLKC